MSETAQAVIWFMTTGSSCRVESCPLITACSNRESQDSRATTRSNCTSRDKNLCISSIPTSGEWDKFQWYLVKTRLIAGRVVERGPFSSRHSNAPSLPLEAITQMVIIVLPLVLLESHFNNLNKCWEVSFCSGWSKKVVDGRPQKEQIDNLNLNSKAVRTELLSASLKDFFKLSVTYKYCLRIRKWESTVKHRHPSTDSFRWKEERVNTTQA